MAESTQQEPSTITESPIVNPTPETLVDLTQKSPTNSPKVSPSNTKLKRKVTSSVWNEFEKVVEGGKSLAICHHCKSKLKAESKNGTTHLHTHLKRCSKRRNVDIRQQLLSVSEGSVSSDGKVKFSNYTFDQELSRKELAKAIILHEYPLSIVEHVGFRRVLNSLQPLFKIVSRNTIRSDILKLHEVEKTKLYHLLDQLQCRVAITTDMWTSNQKKGYMVVTAHFIDDTWKLQNMIIGFLYVPAPHNKEVLCEFLMNCLLDWNLDRKISTITLDNASTNDALIGVMLEKLATSDSLLLDGKLLHMRCAAHILNLIVKDGLDVIGGAIAKIRDSVVFWTATQSRVEKFEEAASQLKISCTKKLSLDCKTRWNSTYLMLESAIYYKDVFPRLKVREKLYSSLPSDVDWNLAKDICGRLKLFYSITEIFSGTRFPTSNFLFPKVCEIKLALRSWCCSGNEVVQKMAENMMDKFNKYWNDCHVVAGLALILDPRYKLKFLEHGFRKIFGSEYLSHLEPMRKACYDLLFEYQVKFKSNNEASEVGGLSETTTCEKQSAEWDLFSEYDILVNDHLSRGVNVKSELDHYLEENVIPRSPDFDILNWWKTNGSKYPTLQLIARDILAIPISTVASESAFSTSGRVVSAHRSKLSPKVLEALMCTRDWEWNTIEGSTSTICRATICDEELDES